MMMSAAEVASGFQLLSQPCRRSSGILQPDRQEHGQYTANLRPIAAVMIVPQIEKKAA